jgi:hypothetical protein
MKVVVRALSVGGALLATVVACGGSGSAGDGRHILTSHQDLCAGAPPDYGDHVVTMVSCPFIQHTDNISKYGAPATGTGALRDGTGLHVATITDTCETWAVGTDMQGVVVIVRFDTGEVVAHGNLHAGQELSKLPPKLALPLAME